MVVTRRGASLLNQNNPTNLSIHHSVSKLKSKSRIKRSRSRSSLSPPIINQSTNSKSKIIKIKNNKLNHQPEIDSNHSNSIHSDQPQDQGNHKKKSLFGFNFDSSSIPVSNFNPTLCYDFSTSFVQPKVNSSNSVQNKPLNSISTLHQSTINSQSNLTSSIKSNSENDEFETMKSAISTITQFLATSNDDPNHTLSIFEGIMSDPVMRARVPNQLLRDYEVALTQKPGCTKQMILIDNLVAATGTATRLAKDLMRRKQQIRNSSIRYPLPDNHQTTFGQSLNKGDPLTEYNLSRCESISPQILSQHHQQQQQEQESSSQVNLNQQETLLQLGPPIQLGQSNSNQESGFDVQSVTPTIIEANPSTSQPRATTSQQPLTIQSGQSGQNPIQTQQINQLQSILNQSTSMKISSIQDSNSIESKRLSKAKNTLTAIRLQSGEEEAKEVYAGFQLMVVYELIGILSTELWSNLYDQYLIENNQVNHQFHPTGLLASGSGSGSGSGNVNGNSNLIVTNDNDNPNPSGSGSGNGNGYLNLNSNQNAP